MKKLSSDMIKSLLRKDDQELAKSPSVFTLDEHKVIRTAVKDTSVRTLKMREKVFVVKRFRHHEENWVTLRPSEGFVPMFSAPVKWVLDSEKEI